MVSVESENQWPVLDYLSWRSTLQTLQLWTQIVGKIRLSRAPWVNHGWQVPLYVNASGFGTSPIPIGSELLEIDFDFISHRLTCRTSRGEDGSFSLEPQSVADFYHRIVALLGTLRVNVEINLTPSEIASPIRFPDDDVHKSYDAEAAHRFWRALLQADRLFKTFRTGFVGKASPVHFFWGSFDLAVTRFSGRKAPPHPGGPGMPAGVARDAYSHEVSSAGFWPGNDAYPHAAFYSYAYPVPPGLDSVQLPVGAKFDTSMGEFLLPYDVVQTSDDADALVHEFLNATYAAAADLGNWDRQELECMYGRPGIPRTS